MKFKKVNFNAVFFVANYNGLC